ncbi:MAG TPA: 3-hydroxyacyl-CoA dehydrogenase NAD-binding domain-containing protein [Terriglobales bacterium]|nr:3-hydroxyacyl-CoA dehydrogenase NAD-binding domain-containing protein [Terriglobales bacterium]
MAEVRTIAVIGAGQLGRGIAQAAAFGGYHTILEDILPNALRRAESELRIQLDQSVGAGRLSANAAHTALSRLEFAGTIEDAARPADLVIEAVPEEMESKVEIFTLLDKICRPGTILASNTVTLSISEIARVTYRARNCLGMRFSPPVDQARRLEIVRGRETGEDTLASAVEVGKRMGREVTVIQDSATWHK